MKEVREIDSRGESLGMGGREVHLLLVRMGKSCGTAACLDTTCPPSRIHNRRLIVGMKRLADARLLGQRALNSGVKRWGLTLVGQATD